jgi:hypothetical protein
MEIAGPSPASTSPVGSSVFREAHNVTRRNDFMILSALLCNFVTSNPAFDAGSELPPFWRLKAPIEQGRWGRRATALLARDEAEKPPKTKRWFRQAQRTVSHAGS